MLIEPGYPLNWVTPSVDLVPNKHSLNELHQVASMPTGPAKIKPIMHLCRDQGIETPKVPKPQSQKHQPGAPWQKNEKTRQKDLNPQEFSLAPNFFLNEDGTSTAQVAQIRAQASGLCIMTPAQSTEWLKESSPISADELGILVLGPLPPTSLKHTSVTGPRFNADGVMVLLQGYTWCNLAQK